MSETTVRHCDGPGCRRTTKDNTPNGWFAVAASAINGGVGVSGDYCSRACIDKALDETLVEAPAGKGK